MPFRKGSVPRRLKGKGIPQKFINQFIEVFNSAYKKTKDDKAAYMQAYGVMNKALHKAGYRKGKDGKWKKAHEALESMAPYGALLRGPVSLEEGASIEDALREGLYYEGVALIDHSVSQLGTGWERYYSPEFNDICMKNTNEATKLGRIATVYNKHGSAMNSWMQMSTKSPIGRIAKPLWREDGEIKYRGFISPTAEGQDVIRLIFDEVIRATSVRMAEVKSSLQRLGSDDDEEGDDYGLIEEMHSARIIGIDLCDEAGITGAGITKVLEEAMASVVPWESDEQEVDMEIVWEELTIEELLENRKDLLDSYVASMLEALTQQSTELQAELEALKAAPVEQTEKVAELELDLAIERAAQIGVGKQIATALKEKVSSAEEIPDALEAIREQALQVVLSGAVQGPVSTKGQASFTKDEGGDDDADDSDDPPKPALTTEQARMMQLASPRR